MLVKKRGRFFLPFNSHPKPNGLIKFLSEMTTQATRAARFWDGLYEQLQGSRPSRAAGVRAAPAPAQRTATSVEAKDEWILTAQDVMRHLPPLSALPAPPAAGARPVDAGAAASSAAGPGGNGGSNGCVYRVLELGCGVSSLAAEVAQHAPYRAAAFAVLGLDISPGAVAEARRRFCGDGSGSGSACARAAPKLGASGDESGDGAGSRSLSSNSVTFEVGDVTALPSAPLCPPGAFALVLDKGTSDTLAYRGRTGETKPLLRAMFAEVERVLAPGGS